MNKKPALVSAFFMNAVKFKHAVNPYALGRMLFLLLLTMLLLIGIYLFHFEAERQQQQEIKEVSRQLDLFSASLKSRIYSNIFAVSGIKSMVAFNPELTQEDFSRALAVQFQEHPDLSAISLSHDLIIRFVHPVEGNEAAIGLDYRTQPEQIQAVQQAIKLNQIVLAGPLNIVQGGVGLIARIPIHILDTTSGQEVFWGLASLVMDANAVFSGAGLNDPGKLNLALRGRDSQGEAGEVFFGDAQVFDQQPITRTIELPYGSWQLAATPLRGWQSYNLASMPLIWVYLLAAFLTSLFAVIIVGLLTENKKILLALKKERDLFAEGPVFNIEWGLQEQGQWPIKSISSNASKILGYGQADMLHPEFSYVDRIHPDDRSSVINRLQHNLRQGVDCFEESYRMQTRAGDYIWLYDFTQLVRNANGQVIGFRSYLYDQTQQKKIEEALRLTEEKLQKTAYELTENIPVGTYTMVQPADGGMAKFSFMSRRFLEQLGGLSYEEAASDPMRVFERLHPEDVDAWVALNTKTFAEKIPFFGEARIIIQDEVRWITAESTPRTLPDQTTVWEGVLIDVTDRKRAEMALNESVQRFNDLVTHVSVGVYVFWIRAEGTPEFEYVSDGWCTMNQLQREAVLQNPLLAWEIIHPDELEAFNQLNEEVARTRQAFRWEGRVIIKGEVRFMLIESTPMFFDKGDSRWFGYQQDVTERRLVEQELKVKTQMLETLSLQDGLTQIANRRYFDERANQEWEKAEATGSPLSLVMMDIDHFKQYNDHYGHAAGDDCLHLVAQALASCCEGSGNLVARYGGEEFVALLPQTDRRVALVLAETLRKAIENLTLVHQYSSVAQVVTLSIGVATYASADTATMDLRQLKEAADQALYHAKRQGRNRVHALNS